MIATETQMTQNVYLLHAVINKYQIFSCKLRRSVNRYRKHYNYLIVPFSRIYEQFGEISYLMFFMIHYQFSTGIPPTHQLTVTHPSDFLATLKNCTVIFLRVKWGDFLSNSLND